MNDFILREAKEKDIEQIIRVWGGSFGDEEGFIRNLLEDCGLLKSAVCAELDGKGRSFMFAFDGLSFGGKKATYIYALCTEPTYRRKGLGKSLTLFAAEMAAARGAEAVFLNPARPELESWYASALGAVPFARVAMKKICLSGASSEIAEEISPLEYLQGRKSAFWQLPYPLILAQGFIHKYYGGGFFRCGENLVCAEKRADGVYVRELIGPHSAASLTAIARHFAAKELFLLQESQTGSPLMFIPPYLPPDDGCPSMPFVLD